MAHDKHSREATASKANAPGDPKVAKHPVPPEDTEDPEDYSDPICVCEPEPYWQEVAERLERERLEQASHAPK